METKVSVIYCTCDNYSDLWDNFFTLFKKYWSDFDGEIVFNTESKDYSCSGLNIVFPKKVSQATSWSNRLYNSLQVCSYENVMILLDDFYFKAPVKHEMFLESLEVIEKDAKIVSISYQTQPGTYKTYNNLKGFDYRRHFSLYTMSTSLTLYKREYLLSLLKEGENAWQFEINATFRSWLKRGIFLCKSENAEDIFVCDGGRLVIRGRFERSVKRYFEEVEGLCFSSNRTVMEERTDVVKRKMNYCKILSYGYQALCSVFWKKPM